MSPPFDEPSEPEPGARRPLLVLRPHAYFSLDELVEVWRYRDLLAILAWRDVSLRYRQAALGVSWALLQPALQTLLFTFLFNRVAGLSPDNGVPFVPFVLSGLAIWNIFSSGLLQATDSLSRNAHLITKVYFPRVILPMASLLVPVIDFGFALLLLGAAMAYYGQRPGPRALLLVPLALQAMLAAAGAGLALSALNVAYRDVRHALPFLTQLLLYAAPVFFPASAVPGWLRPYLDLNPVVPVIDAARAALFGGPLPVGRLGLSLLETTLLLLLGYLYFRRYERTMADRI